jgi:hypothetical protein
MWSFRWMEAQREVDAARGDRLSAVEAHATKRMREFADGIAQQNKTGAVPEFDLASTQFYVAEAEELLARAKTQ